MKLPLPEVTCTIFKKANSKNSIVQYIAPAKEVELNITEAGRQFTVIEDSGLKYYLTSKAEEIPETYDYVLLTNVG